MTVEKTEKPWGYELIWAKTDKYVGKILHINKGCSLSLQYHKVKTETILVKSGTLILEICEDNRGSKFFTLNEGETYHIPCVTIHRMSAVDCDVEVIEVSTPELKDVVRLEDMYGRVGSVTK
jgi:mannose-6-phosphate isomerase-like protein (cupin superfamily)